MRTDQKQKPIFRALLPAALGFLFCGFLGEAGAQVTQFAYFPPPDAAPIYGVGNSLAVTIEARNSGGSVVTSFTDSVVVALYDQVTGLPSDPAAEFVTQGGTAQVGSANFSFDQGKLIFTVTLNSGSDGEYLKVTHAITNGAQYPTTVPFFRVRGASDRYWANDLNGDLETLGYPTETDLLAAVTTGLTGSNKAVTVTPSNGIVGSAAYVITGVNGGYAYGGASVIPSLQFSQSNGVTTPSVTARVILDYDGNLSNYDNPVTSGPVSLQDTVYEQTEVGVSTFPSFSQMTSMSYLAGAPFQPFMTNGKIILRVWSENGPTRILMRYNNVAVVNLSSIEIPYSASNSPPVKGFFRDGPNLVVASGATTSLAYVVHNQYNTGLMAVTVLIPHLPHTGSQRWFVSGAISCAPMGSASVVQATGAAPGTITLSLPTTLTSTNSVTMTIPMIASDTTHPTWQFPIENALTQGGALAPKDSVEAYVETLGVPQQPGSFAGVPIDLDGDGGAVSLSWTQPSTAESPTGYELDRSPGGGSFPVALPFGQTSYIDDPVSNLTGYTYSIVTLNAITQSSAANDGPVTAFENPSSPTGVTALTGGTTVRLNWNAALAGSYSLGGYVIYKGTSPNPTAALVTVGSGTTLYDDTAVSGGTPYYYRIAAIDDQTVTGSPGAGSHISPYTSPDVEGFPPGHPPGSLSVSLTSPAPANLRTSWTIPPSNLGSPVSYFIFRGVNTTPGVTPFAEVPAGSLFYDDGTVSAGNFYVYEVRALYAGAVTTNPAGPVTGYVLPAAPMGLSAFGLPTSIVLNWDDNDPGEAVTQYRIYQGGVPVTVVDPPPSPPASGPLSLAGFALGTNYTFEVSALNAGGEGALSSSVVSARLPTAPTSPASTPDAVDPQDIDLTWSAPSPAQGNITGYNLYRDTDPLGTTKTLLVGGLGALAYSDTTPLSGDAGDDFYYFVHAVNPGGEGPAASVTQRIPPNAPTGIGGTSTSATITVNWSLRPGGENVTGYRVHRVDPSGPTTATFNVGSAIISYDDGSAAIGTVYNYFVAALNAGGLGVASAVTTLSRSPQAPGGTSLAVSLTGNSSTVTFGWGAISEANVLGVTILRNGIPIANQGIAGPYVDAPAPADASVTYQVSAYNAYGGGTPSSPIFILTYPAPVSLSGLTLNVDGVSREATWTTAGTSTATVFNVYRAQGSSAFNLVQTVPAPGITFPVILSLPVQQGQPYVYRITAVNPTGEGPYDNSVTINIPPASPAGLTVVSGLSDTVTHANLSWQAVTGQGVSDYRVYRAPVLAGPYVQIGSTGSQSVTTYLDNDGALSGGATYFYKVTSFNGDQTLLSACAPVSTPVYALPHAPGPVTAIAGNAQVLLSWGATSLSTTYPVAGYDVYQFASGGATFKLNATPVPTTAHTAVTLTNLTTYNYFVRTVDNQGHVGPASGPAFEIPVAPPSVPVSVTHADGVQAVLVTWALSTPGSLPIGTYVIQKIAPGPVTTYISVVGNLNSYADTGLTDLQSYSYSVRAVDSTGVTTGTHASGFSSQVTGIPGTNVNPPDGIVAIGGVGQVNLTWNDSYNGIGAPVTSYQVFRAQLPSGYSVSSSPVTGSQPLVETGLTNGVTYGYYFVAYAGGTASSHSATVFVVPGGPPAAPTGLTKSDGDSQVILNWTANTPVDNIPVSLYRVYRDDGMAGPYSLIGTTFHPTTSYTDTGLVNGLTYNYYLTAVNRNNAVGPSSAVTTAYPYQMGPPILVSHLSGATTVAMNWGAPTTPVSSFPVLDYIIYRGIAPSPAVPLVPSATAPYTDTPPVPGTLYYYGIAAIDDKGHIGPSVEFADGASSPPSAPLSLVAYSGDDEILVDWMPVTVQAPGSLPVSQYRITRDDGSITTILTTQTWYLDTAASNNNPVTYTVESIDVTGQLSPGVHISLPAGPVSATAAVTNVNAPSAVTATPLSSNSIRLDWVPAHDQGRVIAYYVIYRSTSFTGPYSSSVTIINDFLVPPTSYTFTGLSPNRTYYFLMTSHDTTNNVDSSFSNHAWATTPVSPGGALSPAGDIAFDLNVMFPLQGDQLTIRYLPSESGEATIKVYTISGQPILTLSPGPATAGLESSVIWDGRDRNGFTVATGLYLIEVTVGKFHMVKKVAVVK